MHAQNLFFVPVLSEVLYNYLISLSRNSPAVVQLLVLVAEQSGKQP